MKTKYCNGCKKENPVSEFRKMSAAKDGLQRQCKSCMDIASKQCRSNKKEHYTSVAVKRQKKNTEKFREWKSNQGCSFCPENFAQCLEMHHHNDDKEHDVSDLAKWSFERMVQEAKKCT